MDAGSTTALAVAVVGVVGTLLSALLTQRAAELSRMRQEERAEELRERRGEAGLRRACCVALNTASRQYVAALTDQLHALGHEEELRAVRQRLIEARDLHRDVYAEAQMRLPERVLGIAGEVAHALGGVYGSLRRLDDGVPRPGDSVAAAQADIDALWDLLREMRRGMRAEPGVSGPGSGRRHDGSGDPGAATPGAWS
ncbi:hypothetical protein ABZZ17_37145 [Streptomyces sp. NPDC006512]|uniref:hypothetical protein n=1 Tax=Streptomyces sp. NPDC006512 TaxID=3154307 RepID=UPI0033BF2534